MTAAVQIIDPLLSDDDADTVLDEWRAFPSYGLYSNESTRDAYAPELAQRYDAAVNFVRTGGRFGRKDSDRGLMAARTNYFRETYAYGDDIISPRIAELLFRNERLVEAARKLHGRDVIEPAILYANVLVPGQELATHTDVGEFRGANRKVMPQWLIVVMHHSGLFDRWRMPVATGISYFGGGNGGELAYYPDGADGEPATYSPRHNTAALLDTDDVFHGVDRVLGDEANLGLVRPGMRLHYDGDGLWSVREGDTEISTYDEDQVRLSISWKGYCFADEAERDAWRGNTDDLSLDVVLDTLEADLRERGVLTGARPAPPEFGKLLIDTYEKFPAPQPAST